MNKINNKNSKGIRQRTYFAVLELLNSIASEQKYPDMLIGELFKKEDFTPDEKATVVDMAYGLLRHKGRIDHIIGQASSAQISSLQLNLLNILRICTYQLSFTSTSPAGVVNNAVALTSSYEEGRFTGFVKRTCEALIKNIQNVSFPDREKNPIEYISIFHSHPKWIVEKWVKEFEDLESVKAPCSSNNFEPPLTIRVNTIKTDRKKLKELLKNEGYDSSPTSFSPYGLTVEIKKDIFKTEAFRKGLFEVQDEGSQLITLLTGARPEDLVIDACAGNGGKSLFISGLMNNRGTIIAFETHTGKLGNLRRRADRAGALNIKTIADAKVLEKYNSSADCVFIDAPCSGMGVFRRNPDAKWRLTHQDIQELAVKQKEILREYRKLVKPGGRLVYATCTISREENDEVVQGFLEENTDFYIVWASEMNPDILRRFETKEGFFKSFPHVHNTDGFFGAVMKRQINADNAE